MDSHGPPDNAPPDPWTKQPGDYRTSLGARIARTLRAAGWLHLALASLVAFYVNIVWWTSRRTFRGDANLQDLIEGGQTSLVCFWHGRILMLPKIWRRRSNGAALVSSHRDGRLVSDMIRMLGVETISGSTNRGGSEALRQIVRALRSGQTIAVTPDGPRGPRMRMSMGTLVAARLAGVPIVPVAWSCSPAYAAGTWDRHILPLPFGRMIIEIGEPIAVPRDADEPALERLRQLAEQRLTALTDACDRAVGRAPIAPAPQPAPN
jgi:lysophospholipid acyltransferase (LPLAT)-like uncharacterized protein